MDSEPPLARSVLIGAIALVASYAVCRTASRKDSLVQVPREVQPVSNDDQTVSRDKSAISTVAVTPGPKVDKPRKVTVLYGTTTGTAKAFAYNLQQQLLRAGIIVEVSNLAEYDEDSLDKQDVVLFLCSTWSNGQPPESCSFFFEWIRDYAYDFRVSKDHLSKVRFAVFGLGGELYGANFCKSAVELDELLRILGAQSLLSPEMAAAASATAGTSSPAAAEKSDPDVPGSSTVVVGDDASDLEDRFISWSGAVLTACGVDQATQQRLLQENSTAKRAKGGNRAGHNADQMSDAGTSSVAGDGDDVSDAGSVMLDSNGNPMSRRHQKKLARKELYKGKKPKNKNGANNYSTRNYTLTTQESEMLAKTGSLSKVRALANAGLFVEDGSSDAGSVAVNSAGNNTCCSASQSGKTGSGAAGGSGSCGCAEGKSSGSPGGGCGTGTDDNDGEDACGCGTGGLDDELEEEDRINNAFVTMDQVPDVANNGNDDDDDDENSDGKGGSTEKKAVMDLEDIGSSMSAFSKEQQKEVALGLKASASAAASKPDERREMATKLQKKALSKEGYKLIGSHSAVKLCRWTKHQLRGRGGCYKHTFYGITSYQCMEATPSLACANKCVFCWRHHKNPVGTEWRWKEDEPSYIVEEAIRLHRAMINEFKGAPGVKPERLQEAFNVQHCALSLVGEPIMYPRINEMMAELHNRHISTFLVTNAQFADEITSLHPVTQLYVSVDASTRDSLKAIDRPLFQDFWERFLRSLRALKEKQQRTVYRMTLVKDWNMEEAEGYAELVELGQPDLIEIKSVTYCGKSDASTLTMQHVPYHAETCAYADALCTRLNQRGQLPFRYGIATEHEHSCCILLAREDKYRPNGVWHTWIDYPKFHLLMQRYYASDGNETFSSADYIAPTPEWALYKSSTRGFDPDDQRYYRNKVTKELVEFDYKPSDSGCG